MKQQVDLEVLKTRALSLRESLEKMKKYVALSDDEFWSEERNILSVKHLLLQAIEDAASICSHLLARLGGESPSGYADCFQGLERLGILPPGLTPRMMTMARFRNLLVHRYWEVDDRRVLQFARVDADDLYAFLRSVGHFLHAQLL